MNHLISLVCLIGIVSTAVVLGTDTFFLTVGRPALQLASPSAATEVVGFLHLFGDRRMPVWGVLGILSNLLPVLLGGAGHRAAYVVSLFLLILFVVAYNRYSKPINRLQNGSGKDGKDAGQCTPLADFLEPLPHHSSSVAGVVRGMLPAGELPGQ